MHHAGPEVTSPDGIDLDVLTDYLGPRVGGLNGPLQGTLIAGGRSNPTYELSDRSRAWILRRPPIGKVFAAAHDMSRESRVVSALQESPVPVARVVATCPDASVLGVPFYVMDKIDGRTLRTHADTASLTPEQRNDLSGSLVDLLIQLHSIDPADVGLEDFGRPNGYLERQLARWRRQWEEVSTRAMGGDLHELERRLSSSVPPLRYPGIVHGDYKIDNVMVSRDEPARILALLDWEMATIGDTLADLGQLISFWDEPGERHNPVTAGATAHIGFMSADDVLERYAAGRDVDPSVLEWYVVFADFKLAVILEQIHARHVAGHTVGDWFDDIGDMVEPIIAGALERADVASDPRLRRRA